MRERADIGFLHYILGFAVVAQNSAGDPVEPAIVRLHDRANGRLVALAGALDQFGLSGPDGRYLRDLCAAHDDLALFDNTLLPRGWMRQRQIGSRASETIAKGRRASGGSFRRRASGIAPGKQAAAEEGAFQRAIP